MTAVDPGRTATTNTSEAFRLAMRNVASPVSVVTTMVDGQPFGATVSALMSLSMEPPMLVISLDNRSRLLSMLRQGTIVGVDILADGQKDLANHFARRSADKFSLIDWEMTDGAPALPGSHSRITCSVNQFVPAGDHTLIFGAIETAYGYDKQPLVYWQRDYGTVTRL